MKRRQITYKDRLKISRLKALGFGISEIARRMDFNKSSISRELKRNGAVCVADNLFWKNMAEGLSYADLQEELKSAPDFETYNNWSPKQAQKKRNIRMLEAQKLRRCKSSATKNWVIAKLNRGWSPDQIAGRSKRLKGKNVSHEFIYQLIYADKKSGGKLHRKLKRFGKRKQRFNTREYESTIPNRTMIDKRPQIVDKRIRIGDLEGDLMVGYKGRGYLLTLVDRCSRFTVLRKLKSKTKTEVIKALINAVDEMRVGLTLTVDNGTEFSAHEELQRSRGIKVYFAHPYSSFEKGTIENTNGILRMHFPKGTSFSRVKSKKVKKIQTLINNTPRKVLNYLTPAEVHNIKLT